MFTGMLKFAINKCNLKFIWSISLVVRTKFLKINESRLID